MRESSVERRAKIEQWNREKEHLEAGGTVANHNTSIDVQNDYEGNREDYYGHTQQ